MSPKKVFAAALVTLLAVPPVLPAAPLATLNGTVTSVTGRPAAQLDLELVSLDNGRVSRVQTDATGAFKAGLEPGLYSVTPARRAYSVVRGPRVVSLAAGTAISAELAVSGVQDPPVPEEDKDRKTGGLLPGSSSSSTTTGKPGLGAGDKFAIAAFTGGLAFAAIKAATHKSSPSR